MYQAQGQLYLDGIIMQNRLHHPGIITLNIGWDFSYLDEIVRSIFRYKRRERCLLGILSGTKKVVLVILFSEQLYEDNRNYTRNYTRITRTSWVNEETVIQFSFSSQWNIFLFLSKIFSVDTDTTGLLFSCVCEHILLGPKWIMVPLYSDIICVVKCV